MVRIVVYSKQPILVKGLESLVAVDPAVELGATCSDLSVLTSHLVNQQPDLALVDLTPEITADALKQLRVGAPDCKLLLWTDALACDFALQAFGLGIRGILRKTLPLETLRTCFDRVNSGELWFEKILTDKFHDVRRVPLTRREGQLVTLLARGLKNKEISMELGLTEGTVKVYLSHLFQKVGARRFDVALHGVKNLANLGIASDGQCQLRSLVMEPAWR